MSSYFSFGPHSTEDFDMYIEKLPVVKSAKRKRTTVSVPGRNGDLHYSEEAFTNYTQPYECYFHGDVPTPKQAHAIKAWLMASGEYLRLEDSYDPQYYRMATYIGPLDVANYINEYGRCTVSFDCAPQCFLKSGEHPVEFLASGQLYNPTSQKAKPMITVYGDGFGTITVNDTTIVVTKVDGTMILDCEREDAYSMDENGDVIDENSNIYAPVFPVLSSGENAVSFTGFSRIEIVPRWWEL